MRLAFQDELYASVRQLRQDFHIHTERVFLAGAGDGATLAWELFLARPEWFAGLAVFGGQFPCADTACGRHSCVARKDLFLAPAADNSAEVHQADQVGRLMHTAGLEVRIHAHSPGGRMSCCAEPSRLLDHGVDRRLFVRFTEDFSPAIVSVTCSRPPGANWTLPTLTSPNRPCPAIRLRGGTNACFIRPDGHRSRRPLSGDPQLRRDIDGAAARRLPMSPPAPARKKPSADPQSILTHVLLTLAAVILLGQLLAWPSSWLLISLR